MGRFKLFVAVATAALIAVPAGAFPEASAAPACAGSHTGGDWPSLNHDLSNTRHQDAEKKIGPSEAGALAPAWSFSIADAGVAQGSLQSTPVISDGCVYVAVTTGWIFALNADTGKLVWKQHLKGASLLALAVKYGNVYAFPYADKKGPRAIALDQKTGRVVWETPRLVPHETASSSMGQQPNLSPVLFDGMVFFSGSYAYGPVRVPLYFLDAHTGRVIKRFSMLTEKERKKGFGCCAMWATPAIDLKHKIMYAATADSESFTKQYRYNQAIVKIDADRRSPTFGKVLGAYKGVGERYIDDRSPYNFDDSPLCTTFGGPDDPAGGSSTSSSNSCAELDLDFGASPTLFTTDDGTQMVADLQKAGVYHAVKTKTMKGAWTRTLAPPSSLGNAGTGAWDGDSLFVAPNGGNGYAFDIAGIPMWAIHNLDDAARYQPLTVANGVLYTVTNAGTLLGLDSATGVPVLARAIAEDVGADACVTLGTGVAVARNTVYTQCELGWVVAYR